MTPLRFPVLDRPPILNHARSSLLQTKQLSEMTYRGGICLGSTANELGRESSLTEYLLLEQAHGWTFGLTVGVNDLANVELMSLDQKKKLYPWSAKQEQLLILRPPNPRCPTAGKDAGFLHQRPKS